MRQKIAEVGFYNFGRLESSEAIRIAISTHGAAKPGQTTADIAKAQNLDELDAVFDIIIADKGSTCILVRCMSEDDVRTIASEPTATVGSDGPCVSPYGVTGQGKPHPRLIVRYARDLCLLTLPQAIHKMTGMVATALGLVDRCRRFRCSGSH